MLKLVYFWTESRKNIYGCFFHSFCATDLNFGTKNIRGMKYPTVIFASYWGSLLVQFSKFENFLWVCWFSCKNLSNFVSLPWKFHNPYCHNRCHHPKIFRACFVIWFMFFRKKNPRADLEKLSKFGELIWTALQIETWHHFQQISTVWFNVRSLLGVSQK